MSNWSEKTDNSRAGSTPVELPASLPVAPPIAALSVVLPAGGNAGLRPMMEPPAGFEFSAQFSEDLFPSTTGFDGFDLGLPESAGAPIQELPVPMAPVSPPPVAPTLDIFTPPARVQIYEPLEIMDYEEFEPEPYVEPEPEPEPEPPVPAFVTECLPVTVNPAAPAASKALPPMGPLVYAALEPALIEIQLHTLRARLLKGRNPHIPVAVEKPAAEPVAPAASETVETAKATPASGPAVETPKPEPAPKPAVETPKPIPAPERPKISVRPVPPVEKERRARPTPPPVSRPAIAARSGGNALPVEREEPEMAPPPPAPKPKVMPMPSRRPEPISEPSPSIAARMSEGPTLGMPVGGGTSGGVKIAIAGVVLAVLGGGGYFLFSGSSGKATVTPSDDTTTPSSLVVGGGGWTTTWGNDAPVNKNKQISIYRPSMSMSDYRFEFRGQIDRKALGWIFRASNAKNYYVMKLEVIKPGANPLVALVKYAVIEGKETTRTQVMLPFPVKIDTLYQVKLEVRGDKFSTYVQDKLVDFWTDDKVKVGGAGFYNDAGERASIKSSQLSYLSAAAAQ